MICNDTKHFLKCLRPGSRILGLDLGTKKIGLALSDIGLQIATAYDVIIRNKFTRDRVKMHSIIEHKNVGGIVIGFPRNLNGSISKSCHRVYAFIDELSSHMKLPFLMIDERFSTHAVENILVDEVDMTRNRRLQVIDKLSAAYILQIALDLINDDTEKATETVS